jgi:hypothetical protein
MSEKESAEQPSESAAPEKESAEQPSESAAREIAASIAEQAQTRSLTTAVGDPIPVEHGEPVPGGIRPGPDTSHTPGTETDASQSEVPQSSSGEGSSATQPE